VRSFELGLQPRHLSFARSALDRQRRSDLPSVRGSAFPSGARILVLSAPALVRNVPDVFKELLNAGAQVIFSGKQVEKLKIPNEILTHPRASIAELPLRRTGDARRSITILRTAADLTRFLSPDVDGGNWPRMRISRRLLKLLRHPDYEALAAKAAGLRLPRTTHAQVSSAFRDLEHLQPAPPGLVEAIDRLGVDVVLLVTRCTVGGFEQDVIKVARRLGLPSIMLVSSWDNLSSKALLNEHPDRMIVWNEVQAEEAVDFHGISRERVLVVGAPNFDRFFHEVQSHAAAPAGGPADRRAAILYFGSSKAAPDEPAIFTRWINAVRTAADPRLREARIVLRPHPGGSVPWRSWAPPDDPLLSIDLPRKNEPLRLLQLLRDADAVVALSTTAEIEAANAGRPVVTFRAGADAPGQEGLLHFYYLLEERGGFVIDSRDLDEHVVNLSRVLRGNYDPAPIRRFVEGFVRPSGVSQPVSPLVASAVLELARRPAEMTR